MGYKKHSKLLKREKDVQIAISAIQNKEFLSIQSAARYFSIAHSTLSYCITSMKSRAESYKMRQILLNVEEKALVQRITRLISTGYPITPASLKETAEEI